MTIQEKLAQWDELAEPGSNNQTDLAGKVNYLQGIEGGPPGYRLRRVILCNFWLYGLQEFEIPHGRLFLAGENASGKSSVLAAALPLALDGDIRPSRLDTFGTRQRKIDYYVLGSAESSTPYLYDRRTTYVMLEFEWCDPDNPPFAPEIRQNWLEARTQQERERTRWLTIGLSLTGNVNATEKVRPLRFVVTDGSRFGHDWRVVDRQNVAYDHPSFKRVLTEGGRGIVCDTVAEYQAMVARYLFDIQDVRDFQNIISMLLVIRQPNLGTEINFTRVHDYLKQALPRIPEEITRRVTGTLERIDSIQNQLEHLQEAYDATTALDKAAQKLARSGARRTALAYLRARNSESSFEGRQTTLEKDSRIAENELATAQARYAELSREDEEVSGQLAALESSETMQRAEKLATLRALFESAQTNLRQQTGQYKNIQLSLQAVQARCERLAAQWKSDQTASGQQIAELVDYARQKAEWQLAAEQLGAAAREVAAYTLTAT